MTCHPQTCSLQAQLQTAIIKWTLIITSEPAVKERVNLTLENNKRPDESTLLPWAKRKPQAWDVTVPDTYAESHIADTVSTPGAGVEQHKIIKNSLASTHVLLRCLRNSRDMG